MSTRSTISWIRMARLIDLGIPTIRLVLDATKPIVAEAVQPLPEEWHRAGVSLVDSNQMVCGPIV